MRLVITTIVVAVLAASACNGTDDSEGGEIILEGEIVVPAEGRRAADRSASGESRVFPTRPLQGAHVNVCTVQDGALAPLRAHPTVLAGATGRFNISINSRDIPASKQMFVCASEPTSGAYNVLAPVPPHMFPATDTGVTTISVNPDTSSTVITRYACNRAVLFHTPTRCLPITQHPIMTIDAAIGIHLSQITSAPSLSGPGALINAIAADETVAEYLRDWFDEAPDATFEEIVQAAVDFGLVNLPAPSPGTVPGVDAGPGPDGGGPPAPGATVVESFTCDTEGQMPVNVTLTASGRGGGGGVNTFTVDVHNDEGSLGPGIDLDCGTWEESGGIDQCSPGPGAPTTTSWTATTTFPVFELPLEATVEILGYASGSPEVVASDEKSVTCQ
jgi:hypothetical protein